MRTIGIFILIGFALLVNGQSIERQVIGTAGGSVSVSNSELDYSVGEAVTLSSSTGNLTQGFVQPSLITNVSIVKIEKEEFRVKAYPNPVRDQFNILVEAAYGESFTYEIIDQRGSILKSGEWNGAKGDINTSDLEAGSYVLRISGGESFQMKNLRFIKI